ncbi:glycoside hydrolase superfamily [Gorgonomyces haynaldii]|nr:glycoside hydrolase superfamily [Gorgonomyces haynaldii]
MLPLLTVSVSALAPLEPASGFLFGHWYDHIGGDSPALIQQRTQSKPFSLWQIDFDIDSTVHVGGETKTTDLIERSAKQLADLKSDAILYMTIYPKQGFANVTEQALQDWVTKVKAVTDTGRRVMIRYASEMNGYWFPYGQKPTAFKQGYQRVVQAFRAKIPDYRDKLAFVWGPNSGNGYPWETSQEVLDGTGSLSEFQLLDTNKDGIVNNLDDPYSPYYPGDEFVDWVGISMYHYGTAYPWVTNDVPEPNKFVGMLTGTPAPPPAETTAYGRFNFYDLFCVQHDKPFLLTETGATVHMWVNITEEQAMNHSIAGLVNPIPRSDAQSRATIKQAWWRQFLNATFIQRYPKFKGVSTFEFIKYEESTWRDFTNTGKGTDRASPLGKDGGDLDNLVLKAFQDDFNGPLGNLVAWSKQADIPPPKSSASKLEWSLLFVLLL